MTDKLNGAAPSATEETSWPLWEVFAQEKPGAPHEHMGSIHAVDAESALQNARDVYSRRGEAVNLWVVPSSAIVASQPEDRGSFFDPAEDKIYRHPQFYKVPRGLKGF
jgi:ring-1,2-phenylacetyl-CoA epoxidase subunit PaaB